MERVQPARSFFVELAEILLLAGRLYIVITFANPGPSTSSATRLVPTLTTTTMCSRPRSISLHDSGAG